MAALPPTGCVCLAGVLKRPRVAVELGGIVAGQEVEVRAGACGVFPFGFGRQPILLCRSSCSDGGRIPALPSKSSPPPDAAVRDSRSWSHHHRDVLGLGDLVFADGEGSREGHAMLRLLVLGRVGLTEPIRKLPAGTTTISGHSAQSLNEVPGAWAYSDDAAMPNATPTPTASDRRLTTVETAIPLVPHEPRELFLHQGPISPVCGATCDAA